MHWGKNHSLQKDKIYMCLVQLNLPAVQFSENIRVECPLCNLSFNLKSLLWNDADILTPVLARPLCL